MRTRWPSALLAGAAVFLLWRCASYRGSLIDDAYIVFRYADNLIAGHGPVFNPGERVEGFTSPLWLLLLATGRGLGASYESSAANLGTLFALAALLPVWALAREIAPPRAAIVAPLLLAMHPGFAMWAVHGLETSLFVFLVAAAAWTASLAWRDGPEERAPRAPLVAGLLAGLAFWTRPEGALLGVALAAAFWSRAKRREAAVALAAFAALALPLEAARLLYYGAPFPNTFYAKSGGGPGRLWFGLSYAKTFVLSHLLVVVGCLMASPEIVRGGVRRWAPLLVPWSGAFGAAWAVYVVWVGGDAFPGYRFWLPVLPFAGVLIARWLGAQRRFVATSALVIAGVTGFAAVPDVRIEHVTGREFTGKMAAVGRWLSVHAPPGATIAVNYVGAVPYFSGLRTIDMLGLTDPEIARTPIHGRFRFPGHAKGNGASVLDRKPELILMGGVWLETERMDEPHPQLDSEDQIAADPRFAAEYELVNVRVEGGDGPRWFGFYKRKDFAWTP